jgi:DNA-binding LytR/AlgR family response regulator
VRLVTAQHRFITKGRCAGQRRVLDRRFAGMSIQHTRTLLLRADPVARQLAVGFSYWFVFLVALEPGDLISPAWLRLALASGLGASAAPVVVMMVRRFPVAGSHVWRHGAIHVLSSVAIAFGLILASCVLAPMFGIGDTRPVEVALPAHLAANWMLLTFTLGAFAALVHALPFARIEAPVVPAQASGFLSIVPVGVRGRVSLVEMAAVDWIETQGNYLALHAGAATHLIRETSVAFEAKLDPARFVRIHRRTIVAIDRVRELAPMSNGDAVVRMADGQELKVSRGFRARVRQMLEATLAGARVR